MADARRAYVIRDAGSPSRMGRVFKLYPYTLQALLAALDDARFRSYTEAPSSSSGLRARPAPCSAGTRVAAK